MLFTGVGDMSSLDQLNKYKIVGALILVAVVWFAIGFYVGEESAYEQGTVCGDDVITFMNDLTLVFSNVMHAVDTARATYYFIDEHSAITEVITSFGDEVPTGLKRLMLHRQIYFANRTVHLLDLALKNSMELKPVGKVSESDLKLLQNKITEMKQLAVQLRTIAYKSELTEEDVNNANAIVRNMEDLSDDIYSLTRQLLDDAVS